MPAKFCNKHFVLTFCIKKFVEMWDTFLYKHFVYILYKNVDKIYTKVCQNVGYIMYNGNLVVFPSSQQKKLN